MYHEMLVGVVVRALVLMYVVGCEFESHLWLGVDKNRGPTQTAQSESEKTKRTSFKRIHGLTGQISGFSWPQAVRFGWFICIHRYLNRTEDIIILIILYIYLLLF
jgi:hypothetical protein